MQQLMEMFRELSDSVQMVVVWSIVLLLWIVIVNLRSILLEGIFKVKKGQEKSSEDEVEDEVDLGSVCNENINGRHVWGKWEQDGDIQNRRCVNCNYEHYISIEEIGE